MKNVLATAVRVDGPLYDLSESPIWSPGDQSWLFVNINKKTLFKFSYGSRAGSTMVVEVSGDRRKHLCAVIPRVQGGFVAIGTHGIQVMYENGGFVDGTYLELQTDPRCHFNDVQCIGGRLFGGTIDCVNFADPIAAFGEITKRGFQVIQSEHVISNGIGVSPDGTKLLHVESREPWLYVFDRDTATGTLTNRRRAFQIVDGKHPPEALGDGLAMARYNGKPVICLAEWGMSRIGIYDFEGTLVGQIDTPVTRPTSLSFGGDNYNDILITSERLRNDHIGNCGLFMASVVGLSGFAPTLVDWADLAVKALKLLANAGELTLASNTNLWVINDAGLL